MPSCKVCERPDSGGGKTGLCWDCWQLAKSRLHESPQPWPDGPGIDTHALMMRPHYQGVRYMRATGVSTYRSHAWMRREFRTK